MQIQIQSTHFEADEKLLETTTEKFRRFLKFYNRIEKCSVILKHEKNNRRKGFVAEVRLSVPKNDLFAAGRAESFERAIEMVLNDLKRQIIKHKEKLLEQR